MKTATISRTFPVVRLSRDAFRVAGTFCRSLELAVKACERECEKRGMTYDFPTYDETREGLKAIKIGDTFPVQPERDEE